MKRIRFASKLMVFNLFFWIGYNCYFGWNILPINELEKSFDEVFKTLVYISFAIYFLPLLDVYEAFIKKYQ